MRKSIAIAVVAFLAGAASTWALGNTGTGARYPLSSAAKSGIDVLELTMKAGAMPSQAFDAH
jgi:hypothetical protein